MSVTNNDPPDEPLVIRIQAANDNGERTPPLCAEDDPRLPLIVTALVRHIVRRHFREWDEIKSNHCPANDNQPSAEKEG